MINLSQGIAPRFFELYINTPGQHIVDVTKYSRASYVLIGAGGGDGGANLKVPGGCPRGAGGYGGFACGVLGLKDLDSLTVQIGVPGTKGADIRAWGTAPSGTDATDSSIGNFVTCKGGTHGTGGWATGVNRYGPGSPGVGYEPSYGQNVIPFTAFSGSLTTRVIPAFYDGFGKNMQPALAILILE